MSEQKQPQMTYEISDFDMSDDDRPTKYPQVIPWLEIRDNYLVPYLRRRAAAVAAATQSEVDSATGKSIPVDLIKMIVSQSMPSATSIPIFDFNAESRPRNYYGDPMPIVEPEEMSSGVMLLSGRTSWTGSIMVRLSVSRKVFPSKSYKAEAFKPNAPNDRMVEVIYFRPGGYEGGCAALVVNSCCHMYESSHNWDREYEEIHNNSPCDKCWIIGSFNTVSRTFIDLVFNSPVHPDSDIYIEHNFTKPKPKMTSSAKRRARARGNKTK